MKQRTGAARARLRPPVSSSVTCCLSSLSLLDQSTLLSTTTTTSLPATMTTFAIAEGGSIGGILLTVASVIVIFVFALGALVLLMANIIIPRAAEELETKARKEYPELWTQTEAKLKEGETLAMRPDLIQSLGQQVQQGDLDKFQELERQSVEGTETSMETTTTTSKDKTTTADEDNVKDAVDVEVITLTNNKDEGKQQ